MFIPLTLLASIAIVSIRAISMESLQRVDQQQIEEFAMSSSPFFKHQSQIANVVVKMLQFRQDKQALKFLRKTIDIERQWRRRACVIYFGMLPCRMGVGVQPFGIWRKRLVNYLVTDPTDEIIKHLKIDIVEKL